MVLAKLFKNKDILIFQILNWSGTYLLYVVFLNLFSSNIFKKIASGEIFVGAIGSFLIVQSLGRIENKFNIKTEIIDLIYRFIFILFILVLFILFKIDIEFWFAFLPVIFTPTHLPLILGYTKTAYYLISLKLIMAILIYLIKPLYLGSIMIVFLYFLPGIIYGLGIYVFYLTKYKNYNNRVSEKSINISKKPFSHFIVALILSYVNANVVSNVVDKGFYFGALERLLRSTYSFVYPYLVRNKLNTKKNINYYIVIWLIVLYLFEYKISFILIFIPFSIDMYLTLGINKNKKIDTILVIFSLLFLWSIK